ncbi:dUTP diphosphatase [Acinetobacter sp. P1(2025)]|uniref:dUTP diphosphatase n=1 Tax=Acinetobacter sp. P1(2025) TaxID=3446120 RepID=UPI003F52D061
MDIKIKRLNDNAIIPKYAHESDAGLDVTATSKSYDDAGNISYGTGLALSIPAGYAAFLMPRSSISKKNLALANSIGLIDSGYRGEVFFKFKPVASISPKNEGDAVEYIYNENEYEVGERIGQILILPIPKINFVEVDDLDSSDRGEGGFGSTGK